jgi:hypothetical protein
MELGAVQKDLSGHLCPPVPLENGHKGPEPEPASEPGQVPPPRKPRPSPSRKPRSGSIRRSAGGLGRASEPARSPYCPQPPPMAVWAAPQLGKRPGRRGPPSLTRNGLTNLARRRNSAVRAMPSVASVHSKRHARSP